MLKETAKTRTSRQGRVKLSLRAFLRLDDRDAGLRTAPATRSASPSVQSAQIRRNSSLNPLIVAPEHARDYPTPVEAYACKAFKGLCLDCQMIFATWKDPDGLTVPCHERKSAHHSLKELEECWCPLCKMLLGDLQRHRGYVSEDIRHSTIYTVKSDVKVFHHRRYVPCYYVELNFVFDKLRLRPYFMMFIAGRDSPSSAAVIETSTNCAKVWNLATKWFHECLESHEACATYHLPEALPTRLLDLHVDKNSIRLVRTDSLPARTQYATLSHCWGSKPFTKLTRSSYNQFSSQLPFDLLSKTFRDAITAARRLGIRYLWIDSLCIIQQDERDWQYEASKMSQVYSNSSLNFVAADSPDGDSGLFFDNRPSLSSVWKVTFPAGASIPRARTEWDLKEGPRQHTWNCINSQSRALIDDSKVASRAWTLQERLLAPKSLYFGRDQIAWECRDGNAYEALTDMFDEGIVRLSPGNISRLLQESTPFANTENVRQWSHLVEIYSKRSLSFSRDKLVAIAGLARMFAPLYNSNYVAGLWVKDMVRLLAWYRADLKGLVADNVTMRYRAPSWSWASLDGEICYPDAFVSPLEGRYADVEEDLPRPSLAKVLEAVTTFHEDQFGEVTSGFVRIRVQALFRASIDAKRWIRGQDLCVNIRGVGIVKQFMAYPDYDLNSIDGESLLMPLVDGERDYPNDYPEMRGLILDYVEDGVYRRKGAWRIGGSYCVEGLGAEHYKVARMWWAKGAERSAHRAMNGLDDKPFSSLWDGNAYILKII